MTIFIACSYFSKKLRIFHLYKFSLRETFTNPLFKRNDGIQIQIVYCKVIR